jgi:phosphatidylglycerol:prolipoprotein diacylglycerol transferase
LGVALLIGAVIAFLLPHLEVQASDGTPLGLPIRGYGSLLLGGVLAGLATAVYLARRVGLDTEIIFSLSIWMFVAGIVGARIFYLIQYWGGIQAPTLRETVAEMLRFTEGGLVVYGGLVGALIAFLAFTTRHRLPTLLLADIIAPAMVIGLALGRMGCLMNGCCYGATAPEFPLAIGFPRYTSVEQGLLSPPYAHQLRRGELHGIQFGESRDGPQIRRVQPNSPAAATGLKPGTRIRAVDGRAVRDLHDVATVLMRSGPEIRLDADDGRQYQWTVGQLPRISHPVHATQVYAAVNAFLLFLFLMALFPFRSRNGQVFAALMTIYPVTRFLLELIRDDESGQFGTQLTISQLASIIALALVTALWVHLMRQPRLPAKGGA